MKICFAVCIYRLVGLAERYTGDVKGGNTKLSTPNLDLLAQDITISSAAKTVQFSGTQQGGAEVCLSKCRTR